MPDPVRLLTTLRRAIEHTRATSGRRGRLLEPAEIEDALVGGDLHGNVAHFQILMQRADLKNHPRRHLVLQEVIHSHFRYPLGGDKSHQLLDLYAAIKCQFPDRVHLLMGNHEMAQWTGRQIIKDEEDFNEIFVEGVRQAYGQKAEELYAAYLDLFGVLPLALRTPNRVFVSHSLPAPRYLEGIDLSVLASEAPPFEAFLPKGALYALVWGRITAPEHAAAFLAKMDADWLVSGHIACDEGFATPNDRQLILDCAQSPGAYCLFPCDRPVTRDDLLSGVERL